jgi:hypothetical protein
MNLKLDIWNGIDVCIVVGIYLKLCLTCSFSINHSLMPKWDNGNTSGFSMMILLSDDLINKG